MSQTPSAHEAVQPPDPARSRLVRVERLEYGKFCVSATGRIEDMAEHRQLGWSKGFPQGLVNSCAPSIIGISSDAFVFDASLGGPQHGTVLRPAMLGKSQYPVPILCRVRTRSENGENEEGRRYTIARYIAARSADLDPRGLLEAMNSSGLQGTAHADLTPHLPPLWAEPQGVPDGEGLTLFLRESLIYILSGVPVAIASECREEQFFEWVAAIWHALPRALRPHLSAGWGVGGQLSGRLAISYATSQSDTCAAFRPEFGQWTPPARVVVREGGEIRKKEFFPQRLTAGHTYVERVLNWPVRTPARLERLRAAAESWQQANPFPPYKFQKHPDWLDAATARAFRYPGLKKFDDLRADALCRWLERGEYPEGARLNMDARRMGYPENMLRVFAQAVASLGATHSRSRGDAVVWESLRGAHEASFLDHLERESGAEGVARAHLFAALHNFTVTDGLGWLLKSAQASEADHLPAEAAATLHALLSTKESLSEPANLKLHSILLREAYRPEAYLDWLRANPFAPALALLGSGNQDAVNYCKLICELTDSPAVYALRRWIAGGMPSADDRSALGQLGEQDQADFASCLLEAWSDTRNAEPERRKRLRQLLRSLPLLPDTDDPLRLWRERLLHWLSALPFPPDMDDALLLLWFGRKVERRHRYEIMDEVERRGIPPALLPKVSELTLSRWYEFAARVYAKPEVWAVVAGYWPSRVAEALLVEREPAPENVGEMSFMSAAKAVQMRVEQANDLIRAWTAPERRRGLRRFAGLLWLWAVNAVRNNSSRTSAADICRYLDRTSLPPVDGPTEDDMQAFTLLAKEADKGEGLLAESLKLWEGARRGWQLRLLLELFPKQEFTPTIQQLSKLVRYQEWLKAHLKRTTIDDSRKERFKLATISFQALAYPGSEDLSWSDELAHESVLWAGFRDVPLELQGGLFDALLAYGSGRDQQVKLCLKYLRSYAGRPVYEEVLSRVMVEFLFPMLKRERLRTLDIQTLLLPDDDGRWTLSIFTSLRRPVPYYDPVLRPLVDEVIIKASRKLIENSLKTFRKKFKP